MSVHTQIEAPVRHRRRWLVAGAGVLAAGAIAAVLAFTAGTGGKTQSSSPASAAIRDTPIQKPVPSIMSLTPADLASGRLGSSYALPTAKPGPTLQAVLASLSPETRRYTEAVMALTFAQLAAGAAGSP